MSESQLSEHFTLAEFTVTSTGLSNTPNEAESERLETLAVFMEKIRVIGGNRPITVNSAFRSEAVNDAVGGVANSAHRLAYACDFNVQGLSPYQVCLLIDAAEKAGHIKFDQLIQEGTWVHCSRDPQLRGQRLTKAGGGYDSGLHP